MQGRVSPVMEFLEGGTVLQYVTQHKPSLSTILSFAIDVARALTYMHSQSPKVFEFHESVPDFIADCSFRYQM